MIIKRYVVNKMSEAMVQIKKDLGQEAIIISKRRVRKKGFWKYFRSKAIEVTAAVDRITNPEVDAKNIEDLKRLIGRKREMVNESIITPQAPVATEVPVAPKIPIAPQIPIEPIKPKIEDNLSRDVKNIKEMMEDLKSDMGTIAANGRKKSKIEIELIENDVSENVVGNILKRIKYIDKDVNERDKVKIAIKDMVCISHRKDDKIIVLVGPTGVGKTTTIAKLAGKYSLIDKKKVGLITIDTYRIGAVEQLRTYADIMNIPIKVVFSINDMEAAVKGMQNCDVILVDTTGRSSKNAMQISELRAFIDKLKIGNVNLVISCTTKNNDIKTIVKGYSPLNFDNVIITKLDETSTYGSILNIIESAGKPLNFLTTGQNVPDDIKFVDEDKLASLILGGENIC